MSQKQWGSFPDAFGNDDKLFTGGKLGKAVDKDDIDLEGMLRAMEILNNRAKTMNKAQLDRLNYKLGLAVNKFKDGVQKYLRQRWEQNMNKGTLEKVHGNPMDDAGLDTPRENATSRTDAGNTLTKADHRSGDMSDAGLDE